MPSAVQISPQVFARFSKPTSGIVLATVLNLSHYYWKRIKTSPSGSTALCFLLTSILRFISISNGVLVPTRIGSLPDINERVLFEWAQLTHLRMNRWPVRLIGSPIDARPYWTGTSNQSVNFVTSIDSHNPLHFLTHCYSRPFLMLLVRWSLRDLLTSLYVAFEGIIPRASNRTVGVKNIRTGSISVWHLQPSSEHLLPARSVRSDLDHLHVMTIVQK